MKVGAMASKGGMIGVYYSVLEAIETLGVRGTHSVCVLQWFYVVFVFVFVLRFLRFVFFFVSANV
jgi:hypothetical protein